MTAITIQSNKIVLNAVKDNYALVEPSYRKYITDILANLIFPLLPRALHCLISLLLQNTISEIKLLRISKQGQQSMKPSIGPFEC